MLFLFSYISRYGHGPKAQRKNACPAHVLQAAQAFCLPAYMGKSDLFTYNIDNLSRHVDLLHHIARQLFLHGFPSRVNGIFLGAVCADADNSPCLSVNLDSHLDLIVLHGLLIAFRPLCMEHAVVTA